MKLNSTLFRTAVLALSISTTFILAEEMPVTQPAATQPAATEHAAGEPVDPVPHGVITEPYRVCDDLEELTSRINNLYRKPFAKLFDASGAAQPETIFFRDVTSGHEVMSLTRELCSDISHPDLGRPVWTVDGRQILFMGNRAFIDKDGKLKNTGWMGKNFKMNADYSGQRAMIVDMFDDTGKPLGKANGMPGKFNIMDPVEPRVAYYADPNQLFKVTLALDDKPSKAEVIAKFATTQPKFIQAVSKDRKLLIQDNNADPDRKTGQLPYMPQIHVIDLNKKPGEPGFYYHHPMDYGLPEVLGNDGKVLHDAKNNYQFHSLMFGGSSNKIGWNYGPMTQEGEKLGWGLDITNGLDGVPEHGPINSDGGGNQFAQYESHGRFIDDTHVGLYYSGPATVDGQKTGDWGLWLRDYEAGTPPVFITPAPGGHVAGGESFNPNFFAVHIAGSSAEWRKRVPASDSIFAGDARDTKNAAVLCYTYSDVRGGTKVDRKTGKLVWSGMDNNDFRPYSSVPRPLLSRDSTKVWFHSCMLQPTEEWVGVYVAVLRRPEAPTDLVVKTRFKEHAADLTWKPVPLAVETKGFHVYRKDGDAEAVELTQQVVPARGADGKMQESYTFTDKNPKMDGTKSTYFVTAEEWSTLESDTTSNSVEVSVLPTDGIQNDSKPPLTKFDTTAPPAVTNFTAAAEPDAKGQYRLKWDASPASDLRYYNIYFSATAQPGIVQKRLIASPLSQMTNYLDWSAPLTGSAYYAITAVDRQGNESGAVFVAVP